MNQDFATLPRLTSSIHNRTLRSAEAFNIEQNSPLPSKVTIVRRIHDRVPADKIGIFSGWIERNQLTFIKII